ncbi:alpha/beta hydrolase family protein [Phyllobacterium ifriqiyense]|uniref:alpha/beta hydrolase family protein n=1 Tax=Phyllobacterium ifriqiyense TaxID=314238 RepID=UPI0033936D92
MAIEKEAGVSSEDFLVRSALRHVHKIQSETVLLHGRSDDRAPVSQAELFSEALLDVCLPVTLRVFECGHDIPREFLQPVLRPILKRIFDTDKIYN